MELLRYVGLLFVFFAGVGSGFFLACMGIGHLNAELNRRELERQRLRALARAALYHATGRSGALTYAMRVDLANQLLAYFGCASMDEFVDAEAGEKAEFLAQFKKERAQ